MLSVVVLDIANLQKKLAPYLNLSELALNRGSNDLSQSFYIGFSGGLDSTVLLHLFVRLRDQLKDFPLLKAIHVHHGLSQNADRWVLSCQTLCQQWQVPLDVFYVDARPKGRESPEAVAREVRYQAICSLLTKNDIFFTAHHQDDQAETFLLQLVRGAGLIGLSSMAMEKTLGLGKLVRPFLDVSRAEIEAYARQCGLTWLEDESNSNIQFDRNFLRHQVLPLIKQRWPGVAKTITRAAQHCREGQELIDEYFQKDVYTKVSSKCIDPMNVQSGVNYYPQQSLQIEHAYTNEVCNKSENSSAKGVADKTLFSIKQWQQLSLLLRKNYLRNWLIECARAEIQNQEAQKSLTPYVPSLQVLKQIEQNVILARVDANPRYKWGKFLILRFQNHLYFQKIIPSTIKTSFCDEPMIISAESVISSSVITQDCHERIEGDHNANVELLAEKKINLQDILLNLGIKNSKSNYFKIRYRMGGEQIFLHGHHRSLKKLFQQWKIPPWQRNQIPLLYYQQECIAVIGYVVADGWRK